MLGCDKRQVNEDKSSLSPGKTRLLDKWIFEHEIGGCITFPLPITIPRAFLTGYYALRGICYTLGFGAACAYGSLPGTTHVGCDSHMLESRPMSDPLSIPDEKRAGSGHASLFDPLREHPWFLLDYRHGRCGPKWLV